MTQEPRNMAEDRDDIATLLRLAGKRPEVPAERAARVKEAARAQWKQELRGRVRRRRALAVAALATAAGLASVVVVRVAPFGAGGAALPAGGHVVEALSGTVWAGAGEGASRHVLEVGSQLVLHDELTTGPDGAVAIRLGSGHSLRLDASTRVRLLADGVLDLEAGAVYVDSGAERNGAGSLEVRTPLGRVHEIGTQFEVRLGVDSVSVRLREGRVRVERGDDRHEIDRGTELRLTADGSVTRRSIPIHGPDWSWTARVAPVPDLEGRTAREFLEWAARERGWELRFADEEVVRSASEARLAGGARNLDLEQTLEAVLATSRLTHRLEDGTLTIDN